MRAKSWVMCWLLRGQCVCVVKREGGGVVMVSHSYVIGD